MIGCVCQSAFNILCGRYNFCQHLYLLCGCANIFSELTTYQEDSMHEKVEAYLNKMRKQQDEKEQKEREKILYKAGLFERKFLSKDELKNNKEPVYYFFDEAKGENKPYVLQYCAVTDEEFKEIKEYAAESNVKAAKSNSIAVLFKVIAWLTYIFGFIAGFVLADVGYEFVFSAALLYWAGTFVSGTVFLGFAEIIDLLHKLNSK